MVATSPDFKTWTKNRSFYLKGDINGYSKNDFRDPYVFEGEDGKYHMLVSTTKDGKGVLAEYTSADMNNWEHAGIFMSMHWDRFYGGIWFIRICRNTPVRYSILKAVRWMS